MAVKLPKDVVLLQLALLLLRGQSLSYRLLQEEFTLGRRTAERYVHDLIRAGLPIEKHHVGREVEFRLAPTRGQKFSLEAIDIPPAAARSLSLLLVAAALLPAHFGVREAVDATVRASLRLRGMTAARELRRLEDAVVVLENDAKDYRGLSDTFGAVLDAVLDGRALRVRYRSPQFGEGEETFYAATIGLYRGGLYVLAVPPEGPPKWRAMERIVALLDKGWSAPRLSTERRLAALDEAARRWGPARPRPDGDAPTLVTLHFSPRAAPYLLARPWHPGAEIEPWPAAEGGGARMALRLSGDTSMFESWVRSWGPEVAVLRPADMAERIAASFEAAAQGHREAAARFAQDLADDDIG